MTAAAPEAPAGGGHFPGCHPEESEDPRPDKPQAEIQDTEPCWHCGTPTPRGCSCFDCCDDGYIPPTAVYHCPTCKRWWAYMNLNITKITFGEPEPEATS
jgi:hypothetical protein